MRRVITFIRYHFWSIVLCIATCVCLDVGYFSKNDDAMKMGTVLFIILLLKGFYWCENKAALFFFEHGLGKLYILLLILMFFAGILFPPIALISILSLLRQLVIAFGFSLQYSYAVFTTPLRMFREFFTNTIGEKNTEYDARKGCYVAKYPNMFQTIVFGVIGRGIYYLISITLISTIVAYRPYDDGYICKQAAYEAGESVVVKIDGEMQVATVVNFEETEDDRMLVTVNANGKKYETVTSMFDASVETYLKVDKTKGAYKTDTSNLLLQIVHSAVGWVEYHIHRLPRVWRLANTITRMIFEK